MNKLVSIVLPTYNGGNRIKESIGSVINQTYTDWELLVVDDGSTDDTEQVVKYLASSDSRIKYFKNENNLGIQKTLNKGLGEARGKYIGRIDDDDVWIDKDKLRRQVEFLEINTDYILIGTGFIAVNEEGKEIFRFFNPEKDEDIRKEILNKNRFLHSSVVFRKDVALKCGGYSETRDTKHIEDYDLWLKLGILGKFANLTTLSVKFTLRNESISSKNKIEQFKKCLEIIKRYKNNYPNYTRARFFISTRLFFYIIFQIKFFSYFYKSLYKIYKSI